MRSCCDECSSEAALIDHLDLSFGRSRLRRLCGICAQAELERWRRESLTLPAQALAVRDKDCRAA